MRQQSRGSKRSRDRLTPELTAAILADLDFRHGPGTVKVPLGGLGGVFCTLVDEADAIMVTSYHWTATLDSGQHVYALRGLPGNKTWLLHKFLTGYPMTDHANGNGLDNRRVNLREATSSQNGANRHSSRGTSPYLGVHWASRRRKWQATIVKDRRQMWLGYFDTEKEAAAAYDKAAIELHGEFARPNFPVVAECA